MEKYNKGEFVPGSFRVPVSDRMLTTELSEDFTLPDYQPEIRRLLRIDITLPPPARYIGANGAEFSGNAHYDVLYAGGDGQLYTSRLSSEYGFEAPFDDVSDANTGDDVTVLADIVPDTVVGRVMAPRKVGIRTRLRSHVRCFANCRQDEKVTGLDNTTSLRRLTDTGSYANIKHGVEDSIPMSDEVIPEQKEGEIRVIGADGNVFVSEATATNNGVACRGDLILKLMICREGTDGMPEIIVRKLPFSHEISIEGVSPGWDCRAWGTCNDIAVTVGEGRLACEAKMALEADAQKAETFEYTKDMYSTAADSDISMTERNIPVPLRCMNGNFTQSGVFDAKENNIPASARVVDANGNASMNSAAVEKGRCVLTGDVRYNILFNDNGEWSSRELTQPFRYEFDIPAGNPDCSAVLTVTGCRARMDGERIAVDSEIAAAVRAISSQPVRMVDEAVFSGSVSRKRGEWTIVYPDDSDTLWAISKRYHADADRLAVSNAIKASGSPNGADSLAGVKYIII